MSLITNGFDYFGFHEIPTFVLCNPNKTPLKVLSGIDKRSLEWNLNALSTITFTVYPTVDNQSMEYYDLLKSKRLVLVDELAYFIITSVREFDDGITKYKEITANSLEAELIFKKVNLASGTYKFYDVAHPMDSLMGKVLSNCPGWTIGNIDSDLWNKYRNFEVTDTTVYNFLMTTVEDAVECVFQFNTFDKTVSAYSVTNIIKPTNIYLSHDNLMLNTEVTELTDELYTAVQVAGGNGLSIYTVNPLGNSYLYDFSYYKNTDWMPQSLIDAITAWENKVASQTVTHKGLVSNYLTNQNLLYGQPDIVTDTGKYGELDTLNQQMKVLEVELASKIEQGVDLDDVNSRIATKQSDIDAKKSEIQTLIDANTSIVTQLGVINEALSFEINFTADQLKELAPFIIETSYQNENFIQLDTMKPSKIQEQAQLLYDQAVKVLGRISQPRYEFSIDSLNIIFTKEFESFKNQLELGCEIRAELSDGVIHKPVLLQISLNYDDASDFSMTFGNRLRLDSSEFVFADLFGKAVGVSNQIALESGKWNNFDNNYKDEVVDFMNSALNASKNNIVTSANQEFVISEAGLRGRKMLENGDYSPNQLWMNNSMLAFTKDNWNSADLALGEITLTDNTKAYGLVAQAVIGKLIAGNQLLISNSNSSFLVDANGVTVTDSNFTIKHTESGTTTTKSLGAVILELNENIDNVTTEIDSKMVTTFYQNTMPLDAKKGDLWYNTAPSDIVVGAKTYTFGKLYRYNDTNTWDTIEDASIASAVSLAQDAVATADGKICTYFANQKSGSDISPNVTGVTFNEGDLWINTTNSQNSLYRYNETSHTWVLCRDKDIVTATENIASMQTMIGDAFKQNGVLDAGKLDGIIDTTKAYMTGATNQVVFDSTGMWLLNNTVKNNATEAVWMNERGILLGQRALGGTAWLADDFKTAITGKGISADYINTGTLSAITIKAVDMYIGGDGTASGCKFGVTKTGELLGAITGNGNFSVDANGNVVMKGNLTLGGNITWNTHDPLITTAQTTANNAVTTANSASSTANSAYDIADTASSDIASLVDGGYIGGTFIDGKKIYSPSLYSNALTLFPQTTSTTGGLYIKGYWGGVLRNMLSLEYADQGSSPHISMWSPYDAIYDVLFQETNFFNIVRFSGTVDFQGATVQGISTTAKFG